MNDSPPPPSMRRARRARHVRRRRNPRGARGIGVHAPVRAGAPSGLGVLGLLGPARRDVRRTGRGHEPGVRRRRGVAGGRLRVRRRPRDDAPRAHELAALLRLSRRRLPRGRRRPRAVAAPARRPRGARRRAGATAGAGRDCRASGARARPVGPRVRLGDGAAPPGDDPGGSRAAPFSTRRTRWPPDGASVRAKRSPARRTSRSIPEVDAAREALKAVLDVLDGVATSELRTRARRPSGRGAPNAAGWAAAAAHSAPPRAIPRAPSFASSACVPRTGGRASSASRQGGPRRRSRPSCPKPQRADPSNARVRPALDLQRPLARFRLPSSTPAAWRTSSSRPEAVDFGPEPIGRVEPREHGGEGARVDGEARLPRRARHLAERRQARRGRAAPARGGARRWA